MEIRPHLNCVLAAEVLLSLKFRLHKTLLGRSYKKLSIVAAFGERNIGCVKDVWRKDFTFCLIFLFGLGFYHIHIFHLLLF